MIEEKYEGTRQYSVVTCDACYTGLSQAAHFEVEGRWGFAADELKRKGWAIELGMDPRFWRISCQMCKQYVFTKD